MGGETQVVNWSSLTWRETFWILWNYIPYQIRRWTVRVEIRESLEIEEFINMLDGEKNVTSVDIDTVSDTEWKEFLSEVGDVYHQEKEMP